MICYFHLDGNIVGLIQNNGDFVQLHTVIRNFMNFNHRNRNFHNLIYLLLYYFLNPKILLGHRSLSTPLVERSIEHVHLNEGALCLKLRYDFYGNFINYGLLFSIYATSAGARLRKVDLSLVLQLNQLLHLFVVSSCDVQHFRLIELQVLKIHLAYDFSQSINHLLNFSYLLLLNIMPVEKETDTP